MMKIKWLVATALAAVELIQFIFLYSQIEYESQLMTICKQGCEDLSKISALLDEGVDINMTDVKVRLNDSMYAYEYF